MAETQNAAEMNQQLAGARPRGRPPKGDKETRSRTRRTRKANSSTHNSGSTIPTVLTSGGGADYARDIAVLASTITRLQISGAPFTVVRGCVDTLSW